MSHHFSRTLTEHALDRREFMKAALAIGGTSALSACLSRGETHDVPQGPERRSDLPERLHAWNSYLPYGDHGNPKIPGHQLILMLNYAGDGAPTDDERTKVDRAFRSLERAYQLGTGDVFNPTTTEGLLCLVGYSSRYFDRYDESLPSSIDLQTPEAVLDAVGEDASLADHYDAAMVMSSDNVPALLEAEQALRGTLDELNGVPMEGSFAGVLDVADRRTGFIGGGKPATELDRDDIPEHSPQAMGFKSSFSDNQASEDAVTIDHGPFANGTTMHISRLVFDLDRWYQRDKQHRTELMFSPTHTAEDIGRVGEELAGKSNLTEEQADQVEEHARTHGRVGHTQKTAHARDENFEPIILRRSEGVSTDLAEPSMNFTSLQEELADFVETRKAMNGAHNDASVEDAEDGILDFIEIRSRATFLVPPRSLVALPPARPDR